MLFTWQFLFQGVVLIGFISEYWCPCKRSECRGAEAADDISRSHDTAKEHVCVCVCVAAESLHSVLRSLTHSLKVQHSF